MRQILKIMLVAFALLAGAGVASAAEFTLRFASFAPDGDVIDRATKHFKEAVAKHTNGRVEVTIFGNNSLGSNREALEMAKIGGVDFVVAGSSHASRFAPVLHSISLPYMWKDRETMLRLLDGEVGQKITELVEPSGLKIIGWWDLGFRHVSNNEHPILKVEDMKGLKLRTLPSPVHVAFFKALGAIPTPMDWAEVMPALQQGVINGQENPPSVMYPYRVFEFQKYYSLTRHINDPTVVFVSATVFNGLPKDIQDGILLAMKEATDFERQAADQYNTEIMGELGKVMEINEVPEETHVKFREIARSVYDEAYGDLGDDGKAIVEAIIQGSK